MYLWFRPHTYDFRPPLVGLGGDEEDEDGEKSDEEEVEKLPAKAVASAKGAKKRKVPAAVAEEGVAAVAEPLSFPPLSHLWRAVASAPALLLRARDTKPGRGSKHTVNS